MEAVDRDVYFQDVRLQMDAKLWAEEYNRHRPPKKVSKGGTTDTGCPRR
jgi:elongation factor 2 kinase